jgi:hypothetical protein
VAADEHEHAAAQRKVDLAELDVLSGEVLREATATLEHYRSATQGRAELLQAGYVAANLQRRLGLPHREFTSTVRTAINYREPDRPPAARIDWADKIARPDGDAGAELK